jgi:hypothetical protein
MPTPLGEGLNAPPFLRELVWGHELRRVDCESLNLDCIGAFATQQEVAVAPRSIRIIERRLGFHYPEDVVSQQGDGDLAKKDALSEVRVML